MQKNHTLENARKSQLEYDRMENAHHGKWQNSHTMESETKSTIENARIENTHLGKCKKNHTLENGRKLITRKWWNGKCKP